MIFNFFCKRKLFCFVFRQFSRQRLLLSDYLHISENNRSALKRHIIIFNRILSLFFQFQFLKFRKLNHSVQFRFKNILITFDTFYFLLNGFSVQFSSSTNKIKIMASRVFSMTFLAEMILATFFGSVFHVTMSTTKLQGCHFCLLIEWQPC